MYAAEKKYVNVDFFEWLKNKQLQTGVLQDDQKDLAQRIVAARRKSPGPGAYEVTKYSDFTKQSKLTQQNFFGTEKKCIYPDYLKAQGIGDSVSPDLGPGKYSDPAYITTVKSKF